MPRHMASPDTTGIFSSLECEPIHSSYLFSNCAPLNMGGYVCSRHSHCACSAGKIISKSTAVRHYRNAIAMEKRKTRHTRKLVSPPTYVSSNGTNASLTASNSSNTLNTNREPPSATTEDLNFHMQHNVHSGFNDGTRKESELSPSLHIDPEDLNAVSRTDQTSIFDFDPCITLPTSPRSSTQKQHEVIPEDVSHIPSCAEDMQWDQFTDDIFSVKSKARYSETDSEQYVEMDSSKLYELMRDHSFVIAFAIYHGRVTGDMMEDILRDRKAPYSWAGLRAALIRESMLSTRLVPYCFLGHMFLVSEHMNPIDTCQHSKCRYKTPEVSLFTYLSIEDRMRARLGSKTEGPKVYQYYHECLRKSFSSVECSTSFDFTSGRIFKDVVRRLGGVEKVKYDIFVSLSTDGVNAFKKTEYSYWPVVLTLLNIAPCDRFKVSNMMPVSLIPGPNAPSDLISFLNPLLNESKKLENGIEVKMWDGRTRTVRVHILFVLGDLAALKKLTSLRGYNALVPCRFCLIKGQFGPERRHMYYPPFVTENGNEDDRHQSRIRRLWNPNKLPLRTPEQYRQSIEEMQAIANASVAEVNRSCQLIGVEGPQVCQLIRLLNFVEPFHGFPIDLMHLMYENIALDMMSIWCGDSMVIKEISVHNSKQIQAEVNARLLEAGRSFNDRIRRPRGLDKRGRWKATEWKAFVIELSLVVLDCILPQDVLSGWSDFVQLCTLLSKWELSEPDVSRIGYLARRFYRHFIYFYYTGKYERIHLCKYTYHLLLHLEDSLRACGPLSYLSQWSIENFVGMQNRNCNATFRFAQSVSEKKTLLEAAKVYCARHGIGLDLCDKATQSPRSSLVLRSSLPEFDGYSFRHPRRLFSVKGLTAKCGVNVRELIHDYFRRTEERNRNIVHIDDEQELTVWDMLIDEKAADGYYSIYKCALSISTKERARASCYVAGLFQRPGCEHDMDMYYGKVLLFFQCDSGFGTELLCLVAWVSDGMQKTPQNLLCKKGWDSDGSVFTKYSVESVDVISRQIGVLQQVVQVSGRRNTQKRTYFLDSARVREAERYKKNS